LSKLEYGLSITDPCIDWSTTENLLLKLHNSLQNALRPGA
jgi:3-deoxy-7-phosphoheptulonate synthase